MTTGLDLTGIVPVFYVEANTRIGMGHLSRSAVVMNGLSVNGCSAWLCLNADERGVEYAHSRGLQPQQELPDDADALIIDAVNFPDSQVEAAMAYFPRILISPVCNRADLATHVLVRDAPAELLAKLDSSAELQIDNDFAFVTTRLLHPRTLDLNRLRIGVCLSAGDVEFDLDALLIIISQVPTVEEVRIISNRAPLPTGARAKVFHTAPHESPWEFFDGINCFIGSDGLMLAEALAQGFPCVSLSTPERAAKNATLISTGAVRVISRFAPETQLREQLWGLLTDTSRLISMHGSALNIAGSNRATKLTRQLSIILKEMME